MSYCADWENKCLKIKETWPWSDLVGYVMKYARPGNKNFRVLELGCGSGPNIPFFKSLKIQYYSIDGCKTVVEQQKKRFPKYSQNIIRGDFTKEIPFDAKFDLVADRASLFCDNTKNIKDCIALIHKKLKPNGKFIGIDWPSTLDSNYSKKLAVDDEYTCRNFTKGPFANLKRPVHFSDKKHLFDLFNNFTFKIMEHKIIKQQIPDKKLVIAKWNFVAVK